jgi:hypothetical protein
MFPRKRHQMRHLCDLACLLAKQRALPSELCAGSAIQVDSLDSNQEVAHERPWVPCPLMVFVCN